MDSATNAYQNTGTHAVAGYSATLSVPTAIGLPRQTSTYVFEHITTPIMKGSPIPTRLELLAPIPLLTYDATNNQHLKFTLPSNVDTAFITTDTTNDAYFCLLYKQVSEYG